MSYLSLKQLQQLRFSCFCVLLLHPLVLNVVGGCGPFCPPQGKIILSNHVKKRPPTLTPSTSLPANFRSSLMWFLQCLQVQSKKYCVFSSLCLSSDKFKKSTYATVSSSPSEILPRERSSILGSSNTVSEVSHSFSLSFTSSPWR